MHQRSIALCECSLLPERQIPPDACLAWHGWIILIVFFKAKGQLKFVKISLKNNYCLTSLCHAWGHCFHTFDKIRARRNIGAVWFLGAKAPLPLQHVKVKVTAKKFINRNIIIESPYDILYVIGNMICDIQYYKSYINDM